jgi:hypothetical protein
VNEGLRGEAIIRTPDQRCRVFVSSVLGELADERRAVAYAISTLRLTPVMFELGARPHTLPGMCIGLACNQAGDRSPQWPSVMTDNGQVG